MLDGKKILIAEDDVKTAQLYKEYFSFKKETKQALVLYATNVKECITMLDNEKPTLLFLDLGLEDISPPPGFAIIEAYQDKIKIVVISGYHEYKKRCLDLGAVAFLGKPVENKEIVNMMLTFA